MPLDTTRADWWNAPSRYDAKAPGTPVTADNVDCKNLIRYKGRRDIGWVVDYSPYTVLVCFGHRNVPVSYSEIEYA